jgi:hypothetical protein
MPLWHTIGIPFNCYCSMWQIFPQTVECKGMHESVLFTMMHTQAGEIKFWHGIEALVALRKTEVASEDASVRHARNS